MAAVAVFAVLCRYDIALMRWRCALITPGREDSASQLVGGFREFGQATSVIIALIIVATCDRRRKTIMTSILLAELLMILAYKSGKMLIVRDRPLTAIAKLADPHSDGRLGALGSLTSRETWLGWRPGNRAFETQSFPSGHSASAFALAAMLAWFYPRLAWMFWTLAVGCAVSRYVDAMHWPSDCWAGAIMGYLAAWVALKTGGQSPASSQILSERV